MKKNQAVPLDGTTCELKTIFLPHYPAPAGRGSMSEHLQFLLNLLNVEFYLLDLAFKILKH